MKIEPVNSYTKKAETDTKAKEKPAEEKTELFFESAESNEDIKNTDTQGVSLGDLEEGLNAILEDIDYLDDPTMPYEEPEDKRTLEEKILDNAKKFIGYNSLDGSADIFFEMTCADGMSSAAITWDGAFAHYVLKESDMFFAQWYETLEDTINPNSVKEAAEKNKAVVDKKSAKIGDIVIFDYDNDNKQDRIGLITAIDEDGTIHTTEGNINNKVAEKTYAPDYEEKNNTKLTFCRVSE